MPFLASLLELYRRSLKINQLLLWEDELLCPIFRLNARMILA